MFTTTTRSLNDNVYMYLSLSVCVLHIHIHVIVSQTFPHTATIRLISHISVLLLVYMHGFARVYGKINFKQIKHLLLALFHSKLISRNGFNPNIVIEQYLNESSLYEASLFPVLHTSETLNTQI